MIVSTGDKDLAQLVNDRVTLINTMNNETLDVAGVVAKFGVPPERIVDYLTLVGDSVDNVPGVDKVGPKTAVKWLAEYGSLDGVVAAADQIGGTVGENLRSALDWLPTARKLVTVRTDCDLAAQVGLAVARWPGAARGRPRGLARLLRPLGFRAFKREMETAAARPCASRHCRASKARGSATSHSALLRDHPDPATASTIGWRNQRAAPLTAIDTETTSLDAMTARIVGISLSVRPAKRPTSRSRHIYADAPTQLPLDAVLAPLKPWLEDEAAPRSASTSSTTPMCWPITASACAATPTTPCCRATCSRRTCRTAWKDSPNGISAAGA